MDRARPKILTGILVLGAALFVAVVQHHYPIRRWLFWSYATHAFLAACLTLSWVLAGGALLSRLRGRLPLGERAVMSFAVGLYLYSLIVFVAGLLHLFGWAFAVLLPVAMGGAGVMGARRRLRRYVRLLRRAVAEPVRTRSLLSAAVLLFG